MDVTGDDDDLEADSVSPQECKTEDDPQVKVEDDSDDDDTLGDTQGTTINSQGLRRSTRVSRCPL